ncbi:PTS ascorbate transporter subunit IIC [Mycoplasma elephantis]|uniref:PTS ascorbate transporter subunit IIC n=1 Tax=Mycoplasma elephantis TaxID=114882 RepID=UPI00048A2266|nr:PTS ascorbate transporter subunit IIC [Mycoplasma elephantis]
MSEKKTSSKFNWKALLIGLIILGLFVGGYILTVGLKKWDWGVGTSYFMKNILIDNFLGVNAILIGLLVLIGYLVLGRGISESIIGMMKAIIGVLVLSIGSGVLVGMAKVIFMGISKLGSNVTSLDPYMGWVSGENFLKGISAAFVSWISFALLIGFVVNIILVALRKWTNVHSLMITGHVMFQQSALVVTTIFFTMFSGASFLTTDKLPTAAAQAGVVILSGLILGAYWGVASSATIKGSDVVTENAGFAVGHQQMIGAALAYGIGRFFGKKEDSAETKKLSNKIKIFEDNIFTQSLIILILFLILVLILQFVPLRAGVDPATIRFSLDNNVLNSKVYGSWNVAGGAFWAINLILGSLKLVGSILVIQMGVRMFVTELQQSFQGISEKLVPGAVVAVDCAATYGFSPNSVTYGFVSGTIAQFAAVGIILALSLAKIGNFELVTPIPLFITLFFNSGTIGVFANASGGFKASLIVPAIFGFVEIIVIALGLSMIQNYGGCGTEFIKDGTVLKPYTTGYNGMFDWTLIWGLLLIVASWNMYASFIVFLLVPVILIIAAQIIDSNRQEKQTLLQKLFRINPTLKKDIKESTI